MKPQTKKLSVLGLSIGIILAAPKIVAASLSDWLIWGGVGCTVVAIISSFTPAAPVAPVLGAVEVVGIIVGTLTHPAVTGVPQANATFNLDDEKLMMAEFLVTDLAMLELPTGEDAEYAPLFAQANLVIEEYNRLRQHMAEGRDDSTIAADLFVLASAVSDLADGIAQSSVDITVGAEDMNVTWESIETDGLPDFELDHLVRSGFSQDAIDAFADLHSTASPNGVGFTEPTSLSGAVRNVADRFTEIAIELTSGVEPVPGDAVIDVIVSSPQ